MFSVSGDASPQPETQQCDLPEKIVIAASSSAAYYEAQMKELEGLFSENLSNFRAIDNMMQEAFLGIHGNSRRADKAIKSHIPHILKELDESEKVLSELKDTLPKIRVKVKAIQSLYDSGRIKAQELMKDLEWLDTDFYERWRAIIFTNKSPVSRRWKIIMRLAFAVAFSIFAFFAYLTFRGAYRAHRHRLVWGERLMS